MSRFYRFYYVENADPIVAFVSADSKQEAVRKGKEQFLQGCFHEECINSSCSLVSKGNNNNSCSCDNCVQNIDESPKSTANRRMEIAEILFEQEPTEITSDFLVIT